MAVDIDQIARLLAYHTRQAQLRASHLQVAIQPHAIILAPVAMAGEDTTIHCMAFGHIGEPPQILSIGEPRWRDDQYRLFAASGAQLGAYANWCVTMHTSPQFWVSSGVAADHLDVVAERLCFERQNPEVRQLGQLLAYAAGRYPVAGQQILIPATKALTMHWATGQQPSEDEHLGALLAWFNPPANGDVWAAVAEAERTPMG